MSASQRVGLSPAGLEYFDQAMKEKYLDRGYLPGTITQIWRRGELAHSSVLGSMDLDRGKPMREDTICRSGNSSKKMRPINRA